MHSDEFKLKIFPLKNRLYRFARWLIQDSVEAEDLVQEVFLKLWEMRNELSKYHNLEALAMKMTKNQCLNNLKRIKRFISDAPNPNLTNTLPTPYEKMVSEDKSAFINQIIFSLPEQQRIVVQLRDIEGFSVEEISLITELKENNIWVILSRARKNIRDVYLKSEYND